MNRSLSRRKATSDPLGRCLALFGPSAGIRWARSAAQTAATATVPALVVREPGCLGESVARAVHDAGTRTDDPFVAIDCGQPASQEIIRSLARDPAAVIAELDGRPFRRTATVFLDRIERLSGHVQKDLAHELDQGQLVHDRGVVRILAGTTEDLRMRISAGTFHQDLYYRLAVLTIEIPPLRERREDIVPSLEFVLIDLADQLKRPPPSVSRRIADPCTRYHWPGNAREVRCVAERLLASSPTSVLDPSALPMEIRSPAPPRHEHVPFDLPPEGVDLDTVERELIRQALQQQSQNRTRAARMLGLSRQQLLYRMQKHGLR